MSADSTCFSSGNAGPSSRLTTGSAPARGALSAAAQVLDRADPGLQAQPVQEVGEVGVAEEGAEFAPEAQVVADEDGEVAGGGGALGLLRAAAYPRHGRGDARVVGVAVAGAVGGGCSPRRIASGGRDA